jgi:DNA repair protein RadC
VTEKVRQALGLVDICLLDHLVLGQGEFFSFAKAGFL